MAEPAEIGPLVCYLASPRSNFVSGAVYVIDGGETAAIDYIQGLVATGTPPAQIATTVVDAIHKQRFYVIPHPEALPIVRQRMEDILEGRSPILGPPWAPLRSR